MWSKGWMNVMRMIILKSIYAHIVAHDNFNSKLPYADKCDQILENHPHGVESKWTFKIGIVFLIVETTFQKSLKLSCYQRFIPYTLMGKNLWYCVSENVHAPIKFGQKWCCGFMNKRCQKIEPVQWMCNTNNG